MSGTGQAEGTKDRANGTKDRADGIKDRANGRMNPPSTDQTDGICGSKPTHHTADTSSTNNSQLATQPLDDTEEEESPTQTQSKVWGQLYPHCGTFPRLALSQDSFKLGRGRSMEYVITESDMGSQKWLTAVSKCQCEIFRNKNGVFLRDHSSNGTWVNGFKIGKNNMRPLEHDSEICFAGLNKKVFVYRSTDPQREIFPPELTDKYTVSKVLGRGACGEVRLGFRIPDLHRVAIKVINKRTTSTVPSNSQTIMNEVRILQSVNHPCIINLEDVIHTQDYLFIVLELAEGGELFEKIIEKTKFNEFEAKLHFYQIASAIQYLHSKNICHRDLKPENVLLCSLDDNKPVVKITDMGLSKLVDLGPGGTVLKTFCGTPNYLAPEVIESASSSFGTYTMKVDCWSLGVILYIILSGTPPFTNERQCNKPLRQQIMQADFIFYPQLFNSVSKEAKDLIRSLLKVRPSERLSAEDILLHPWLQDTAARQKAEALMREQQSGLNILRPIQTNGPVGPTNRPPVTLTVMKRPVPMDVDPPAAAADPIPEKRHRVEINLVSENNAAYRPPCAFQSPRPPSDVN